MSSNVDLWIFKSDTYLEVQKELVCLFQFSLISKSWFNILNDTNFEHHRTKQKVSTYLWFTWFQNLNFEHLLEFLIWSIGSTFSFFYYNLPNLNVVPRSQFELWSESDESNISFELLNLNSTTDLTLLHWACEV